MRKRGGRKKFSTPEEIEAQRLEIEKMSLGDVGENEDEEGSGKDGVVQNSNANKEDSSGEESGEEVRAKGTESACVD